MDAVEVARQRATELHFQAVARGVDPWAPYDFVVAEAKARGIKVEKCAPGAAVLDGGRAFFDSEYRLIIHVDRGSRFEQAFLVAHEIGHAELGDDAEGERALEIEPTRASESAPVGMDRVVDYSRRQRREVQMDLFAREFLLPRTVAKKLHLESRMTCSDIANRLGAPFDVIAQQLFDALLLPAVVIGAGPDTPEIPLNEKQRHAAHHRGPAFLLQAGPGTGKTRTLVARVESLLDEGVDPRRILLLTFSNKAAAEMAERIARKRPVAVAALWMGTFHGFGLDLLRRFHDLCDLPVNPRLMDRTEAVELLEHEFPRLGLVHYRDLYDPSQNIADILNAISRAKDEVIDAGQYRNLAQAMANAASSAEEISAAERAMEVAAVYEVYEEMKRRAGSLDFGDLVLRPVQLIEAHATIRQQLQGDYDHVLVDEYQDVNRSSIRLLSALKPDGANLWVVGDAKQSIYRFRGASSFNMSRFGIQDFAGGVTDFLEVNYRSVPEIVGTFSEFAASMKAGGTQSRLEAHRQASGNPPELRTVATGSLVSSALAECIEQMRSAGLSYRDQAVLCRGNDKLSEMGQELERLGIPVLFLGSLFERQEVKDLVAVLSLLTDRRAMGLVRTACWPDFAMSMEDVTLVFEHLRSAELEPGAWSGGVPALSEPGRKALARLGAALRGFDRSSNPWSVLARVLLDGTRVPAAIASSGSVADQARGIAIWQFMNFVRAQPGGPGLPIIRLMDRVRRLLRLRDDRELRQLPAAARSIDAVRLMTIHGSKGLEFPVVHLTGANHDTMPGSFRPAACPPPDGMVVGGEGASASVARAAHTEEQECLFYVAMSRAQDRLFLYGATAKGKAKRPLSGFVERIGPVTPTPVSPTWQLADAPESIELNVEFRGNASFSAQAVALYETCRRRFLYTHLLQVGGRRQASAFMQMHDAVRSVFLAVIEAGSASVGSWEELLEAAFGRLGLHEHGYAADYRDIAKAMLRYFLDSREGATIETATALMVAFGDEQIEVRPDEILVRNGVRTLRSVKTGHAPTSEPRDVGAAAFLLAAQKAFPGAAVELVYLADRQVRPLNLKPKELDDRHVKLRDMLVDIRAGRFDVKRSEFVCPNCPAFFVCGATPPGKVSKTF